MDTQLIAHDREVYDIAWGGVGVFASVSADGSVRVFDLRYSPDAPQLQCLLGLESLLQSLRLLTLLRRCLAAYTRV